MIINSLNNSKVKNWTKLKQKKYRDLTNTFLVEGDHLVNEAIKNNLAMEIISLHDFASDLPTYVVSKEVMQKITIDNIIKEKESVYNNEEVKVQTEFNFKEETTEPIIVNEQMKELVLYPVGLAHGTYIIAENEEGIYLIDQHAAQERVNYERNLAALKSKEIYTTSLLIPITIELSSGEMAKVKEEETKLRELGLKNSV